MVVVIAGAAVWNHHDVQQSTINERYSGSLTVLRTPDERFNALTDFPYEPHYIEIHDPDLGPMRIHYLDEGPRDGHVITLLHGQATWSYSFRKMIPLFVAKGYRVVAPDLVGFGRSDKPADWEQHTFAKHVQWLDATLSALNIRDSTGFLFDWGGYFGLRIAAEKPDVFSRLVLCTTTMPRANSALGAAWVAGWRRYILKPKVFPISGMVAEMVGNAIDDTTAAGLDAPYPDDYFKAGPRRFPLMIPATAMHPAATPNRAAWEKLAGWDKPSLTLVAESLAQRGFNPKEFHDHLPGTVDQPHAIYPNTGFFLIEDVPVELAERTLMFIEQS